MRLTIIRALTVALAVLGGAGAMIFPKLIVARAVPDPASPFVAAPAPARVPVIQIGPTPTAVPRAARPAVRARPAAPKPPAAAPTQADGDVLIVARPAQPRPAAPTRPAPAAPRAHAATRPPEPTPPPAAAPALAPARTPVSAPPPERVVRTVSAIPAPHEDEPSSEPTRARKPKKAKKAKREKPHEHGTRGEDARRTPAAEASQTAPTAEEETDGAGDGGGEPVEGGPEDGERAEHGKGHGKQKRKDG